jgi:hypothetical protein
MILLENIGIALLVVLGVMLARAVGVTLARRGYPDELIRMSGSDPNATFWQKMTFRDGVKRGREVN